ncbi:MAG: malate dehydrogenase, partial [Betaproteobacteria bacterium]|nr:malate dehydrogenase [Betaproteobacteria bacterium]
ERFIECVAAISNGFGAINLEDIAAPECFLIEERLSEQLAIPVMHDDQTGTGVVACAALVNALEIQGKRAEDVRIVCVGAGAAGIGVLRMITNYFSISPYQVTLIDSRGMVTCDRSSIPNFQMPFARQPIAGASDPSQIYRGADVLIGVSGAGTVSADAVRVMAANPIVLALSNPNPEITPEEVVAVRSDAIVGTGRSDYPNQVNNSLCYPYMFRGALDARAKKFTRQMYAAAIKSIADLAREPVPARIRKLYPQEKMVFGREYIMPKQDDSRLLERVSSAVRAAYAPKAAKRVK